MLLHKDTNKPDRQLFHDDIEGSKPKMKWRFRTNRCVNPLEPEYTFPSYVPAPNVSPKFTRDSYDVSDIEGTKSRPLYRFLERKNHLVDDIEGAQSGWRPRHSRARHEAPPLDHSLNVGDITGGGFRTRRMTNPLTPSYRVNGMDIADNPVTSRPRSLPKARDGPFYPLTTVDIEGAQPGWRPMPQVNPPLEARRHFRNTNFVGDIPGAQADTVEHSICTNRHVNPLYPLYSSLDGEPLENPQTPLYKEPACVEAEAQLDMTTAFEEALAATANNGSVAVVRPGSRPGNEEPKAGDSVGNRQTSEQQQQKERVRSSRERPSSEPLPSDRRSATCSGGSGDGRRTSTEGATKISDGGRVSSSYSTVNRGPGNNSDKDDIIRRLEHEVRSLRKEGGSSAWQKCKSPSSGVVVAQSNHGSGRATPRSWPGSAARARTCSRRGTINTSRSDENMQRRLSASSEGARMGLTAGGVAPRAPFSGGSRSVEGCRRRERGRESKVIGGEAVEIRSRGEHGDGGGERAERLVLRSANGTPRVSLTPAEIRVARKYVDDVSSVRNLV